MPVLPDDAQLYPFARFSIDPLGYPLRAAVSAWVGRTGRPIDPSLEAQLTDLLDTANLKRSSLVVYARRVSEGCEAVLMSIPEELPPPGFAVTADKHLVRTLLVDVESVVVALNTLLQVVAKLALFVEAELMGGTRPAERDYYQIPGHSAEEVAFWRGLRIEYVHSSASWLGLTARNGRAEVCFYSAGGKGARGDSRDVFLLKDLQALWRAVAQHVEEVEGTLVQKVSAA